MSRLRLLALVFGSGLLAIGLLVSASVTHDYQQQQEFDRSLRAHDIEPSLQGVENYVANAVQPGISKSNLLQRLAPIGVVGHIGVDLPGCEEIRVFLRHVPGDPLPFLHSVPPVYEVEVCYHAGLINRVGVIKFVVVG